MTLYAWVGEDEHGSGKVGLKQGLVPAGLVPLAAMDYDLHKLERLKPQMEKQAARYGKKIQLCRFEMSGMIYETEAGN